MDGTTSLNRVRKLARGRRRDATLVFTIALGIAAAVGAGFALVEQIQLLFYPCIVVLLASITYLGSGFAAPVDYDALHRVVPDPRVFDVLLSVGVVVTVALSQVSELGLIEIYYWFLPVMALFFAVRILIRPSKWTLYQLILYAIAIRAAIWFSAPMVGTDTHVHLALTEFVVESGELPPSSVSYYHWYPMAHVTTAVITQLSTSTVKQSFFLVTGVYAGVSLVMVYLFTRTALGNVLNRDDRWRAALFAALVVAVAPWHIRRTGVVIAQSMGLATVPFALYAALRFEERKFAILFVLFTTLIVFTHNLTPAVLAFVLATLFVSNWLAEKIDDYVLDWRPLNVGFGLTLVLAVVVLTIQYWVFIGYFDLQVFRITVLLLGGDSVAEIAQQSSLSSATAFTLADTFLHLGIEQLVFGAVLTLFAYVALGKTRRSERFETVPMALYIAGSAVFLVLSVSLVVGWQASVVRALPNITIVVAPLFGYLLVRTFRSQSTIALVLIGLVLAFPVIGGLAATVGTVSPSISPTEERGSSGFVTASQHAGIEYVLRRGVPSGTYVSTTDFARAANFREAVRDGKIRADESRLGVPLMNVPRPIKNIGPAGATNRSWVLDYLRSGPERYYVDVIGTKPTIRPLPSSCSVVYDAGDVEVVTCSHTP